MQNLSTNTNYRRLGAFGPWQVLEKLPPFKATIWANFKVCRIVEVRRRWGVKNAFYVAWNWEAQRFSETPYANALATQEPALFQWLVRNLKRVYHPGFLAGTDTRGYKTDPAQLQECRDRQADLDRMREQQAGIGSIFD